MSEREPAGPALVVRRILTLASGDAMARVLGFVAFLYLARTLGTRTFGVLEFATTVLLYATLVADAGLEAWGARAVAQAGAPGPLVGKVTGLRLVFASLAFALLLAILPVMPAMAGLRSLLVVLGLTLFPQAVSLKWLFMGRQDMRPIAAGLVGMNLLFLVGTVALVHDPGGLLSVAWVRLVSELVLAGYFALRFVARHGRIPRPNLAGVRSDLGSVLTFGASSALSMINYNFDAVLLGFMAGTTAVGWYAAAYKPVTVALALPMTFFVGLFPALANAFHRDRDAFRALVGLAIRLTAIAAVPFGVGGALLARPLILVMFGEAYAPAIPVLQLLAWSLVPVMLRGTFRQGLKVAGHERVELGCAAAASTLNVLLNVLLIPAHGMIGAAVATLVAELVWLGLVVNRMSALVIDAGLLGHLWRPILAGVAMAMALRLGGPLPWVLRGGVGLAVYTVTVFAVGGVTMRDLRTLRSR